MGSWYEIKVRGALAPAEGDQKSMVVLNRTLRWGKWGLEMLADSRQAEEIVKGMGLATESQCLEILGKEQPGRSHAPHAQP